MREVFIKSTGRDDIAFSELTESLFSINTRKSGKSKRAEFEKYDDPVAFLEDYGFKRNELYNLYPDELSTKHDPSEAIIEVFNKISSIPIKKNIPVNENSSASVVQW